jgi:hypothetical protein
MEKTKNSAIYNINFPVHLSLHCSINQHLWDVFKNEIDFGFCEGNIDAPPALLFQARFRQGFYSFSVIGLLGVFAAFNQRKTDFISTNINIANRQNERTFVRFNEEFDSRDCSLRNATVFANLLLSKASEKHISETFWPGIAWLDDRGYCCFQPTTTALALWLQFLWAHPPRSLPLLPHADQSLVYIEQRCRQILKLASPAANPWLAGELQLTTSTEQELVWGLIEVYDALHNSPIHQVKTASKSLIERFLAFDRHCRLLDLPPNSAELFARAGLILLVQRATVAMLIRMETV